MLHSAEQVEEFRRTVHPICINYPMTLPQKANQHFASTVNNFGGMANRKSGTL
jgi:hypothetical protein